MIDSVTMNYCASADETVSFGNGLCIIDSALLFVLLRLITRGELSE